MPTMDGIRARLDRAHEHLKNLDDEVTRVVNELYRDGLIRDIDERTGEHVWTVNAPPVLAARISLLAGDFVHNLRSGLDHVVWELTSDDAKSRGRDRGTRQNALPEFPIYESPGMGGGNFHESAIGKIWSLPLDAKVLIERLQPYQGGNQPLLTIQRLDNIDKHRRLLAVPYALKSTDITFGPGPYAIDMGGTKQGGNAGRFQHGDELARTAFQPGSTGVDQMNLHPTFQVSLEEERISGPIMTTLTPLYEFVRDKVLPQFEPFFK